MSKGASHTNDRANGDHHWSCLSGALGVSVIKPLLGVDDNLKQNLETFFHLNYPTFELLFCVQDPDDKAVSLVRTLILQHPHVEARLFIGGSQVGANPKINNMQPAYEASRFDLVLISDSGIRTEQDTLHEMVGKMGANVGLVHQMPFANDGRPGFHATVEKVFFGTAHAKAYLSADLLGVVCVIGMSMMIRKQALDELGGLRAFGHYLAEDFFISSSLVNRGWAIELSSRLALQNFSNQHDNLGVVFGRFGRWAKLRLVMVPHWTILEPISECMLLGIIVAILFSHFWGFRVYIFLASHIMAWLILDYFLIRTVQGGPLEFGFHRFTLAWLVRETCALPIFLWAITHPHVTWRSRKFRLFWGGQTQEIVA